MKTLHHSSHTPQQEALARRRFLQSTIKSGLYAGALLLLPGTSFGKALKETGSAGVFEIAEEAKRDLRFALSRSTFAPHLGSAFRVEGQVNLTLVEIGRLMRPRGIEEAAFDERSFKLVLRGRKQAPLAQHTYRLRHADLGAFDLFLVPVGKSEQWQFYEAIFNRLA